MWTDVTVPAWLLGALGLLAAIAVVDRLARPMIRWLIARRRRRTIAILNQQLRLRIARFKLLRRRDVIARLMLDPVVQKAVEDEAKATGLRPGAVARTARGYAREIVPAFSSTLYFRVGTRLARMLSTFLYRVRIGVSDGKALEHIDPDAAVVFVINHRSNMDYVLVTYLASASSALSYAVGEWARVPGIEGLIRLMGAYFIRRDSGNQLYRKVLASYVHTATAAGVTQAVFPEGGLSRDGALQPARLGLISYMVAGFDPNGPRDVVFVPVGLNYDRVLEDRMLTAAAAAPKGSRPQFGFRLPTFLGFVLRNLFGRLVGRWYRYGYACVSFGRPLSLRAHLAERSVDLRALPDAERFGEIERLGARLMAAVGHAVPALPVALVAHVVLASDAAALSALEIKGRVFELINELAAGGAEVYIPRSDREYAVDVGRRMLELRRLLVEDEGLYRAPTGARALLAYYANAIEHHLGRQPWPVVGVADVARPLVAVMPR